MRDDEPADAVHDLFSETLFGADTALGRSVLGTVESIEGLHRDDVNGWYRGRYTVPQIVVTAAGRVDHQQVVELVGAAFAARLGGAEAPATLRLGESVPDRPDRPFGLISRSTEQTHLLIGTSGMGRQDERRYAAAVLDTAVGGGMSSRLFQEIREKRGLVYSVGSGLTHYAGTGAFSVYAACSKKRVAEVLRLVRAELDRVATDGLTPEEVARGRGQLRGALVLGLEDTGSRMSRLGRSELAYGEYLPVREVLARIGAVDETQVAEVAADLFTRETCLAVVGPYRESDLDRL